MNKGEKFLAQLIWSMFASDTPNPIRKCKESDNLCPYGFDEDEFIETFTYRDSEGIIISNSEIISESIGELIDVTDENLEKSVDEVIELLLSDLENIYKTRGIEFRKDPDYGCMLYVVMIGDGKKYTEVSMSNFNELCRIGINELMDRIHVLPKYKKYVEMFN